ncbi:hypothetical protein [Sphingomonas sp.]|uniref:hypothetical protein n=1 Tax=Sphingomonas sp. TaxID=28214 RepID=UPI001EBF0779|nr:hypothetical protein [Sphingomonas sp.]MBX3595070.1 hypothetical protein [Sphingomonas sp.]
MASIAATISPGLNDQRGPAANDTSTLDDLAVARALRRIRTGKPFHISGQRVLAVKNGAGEEITLISVEPQPGRSVVTLWSIQPNVVRALLAEGVISFD